MMRLAAALILREIYESHTVIVGIETLRSVNP
jgi:hypothetical protein